MVGDWAFTARATSRPSMAGMPKAVRTTSKPSPRAEAAAGARSAAGPLAATTTV